MTRQHAVLTVAVTYDADQIQARDLIPTARIRIGDSLEGLAGVTGWRITAAEPVVEEPAR